MASVTSLLCGLLLCATSMRAVAAEPPTTLLAVVGGMLLDGYGGPPLHNATVLIQDNRIVAVGPASSVIIPPGTHIIDTRGDTMIPGLIEVHAHLVLVGDGDIERWFKWLAAHKDAYPIERVMELSARQLLAAGITSAIDLGGPLKESLEVRDRIAAGVIPGPRLSVSGPWLIPSPAIFPAIYQTVVHNPAEAAQATEQHIKDGVDVIKLQGGLTLDEYRAVVDVAHRHGIKVHAHLYDEQAVRNAFTAGVDVLQHVGAAGTPPYDPLLVAAIAQAKRPVVPTAAHRVWVMPATRQFPERLNDPTLEQQFPPQMWAELQDSFRDFENLGYFKNHDVEERNGEVSIAQWIRARAVIGMGSDSGSPLNFHADALWREAKALVDHGLPASEAISALTLVNARILGRELDLGTVEVRKLADIAVFKGDPLFDIATLATVDFVIKNGVVYRDVARLAATRRNTPMPR